MPQITQFSGLCCVDKNTVRLVYCDNFSSSHSSDIAILTSTRKFGVTTKTLTTVKEINRSGRQITDCVHC